MKQQESTLLDLKAYEEGLRGFDFICKTYEEKLKFLCQKLPVCGRNLYNCFVSFFSLSLFLSAAFRF